MENRPTTIRFMVAGLLALALVAAGCGDDTDDRATPSGEATTAAPEGDSETAETSGDGPQPDPEATMHLTHTIRPTQWDPHNGGSTIVDYSIMGPIYDRLLILEPDMTVGPMLATEWELSNDNRTLTFELRDDVTFHDGSEFDSEVVKANIERAQQQDTHYAGQLEIVNEVVIEDPYTVRLELNADGLNLPLTLAQNVGAAGMISPRGLADPDSLATEPAGSGPYELVEQREDAAVYEKWDDYWDQDLIERAPRRIVLQAIPDSDARLAAIQTFETHGIVLTDPLENLQDVLTDDILLHEPEGSTRHFLNAVDMSHPALADVNVRRALSLAIDREAINEFVLFNTCEPAVSPFGEGTLGHDPDIEVEYDPDEARRLIDESGFEDISLELLHISQTAQTNLATAVQEQWAQIGVEAELRPVEPALGNSTFNAGETDVYQQRSASFPDPAPMVQNNYIDLPGGTDPELEALQEAASVLPLGSDERHAAYQEIGRYLAENPVNPVICITPPQSLHTSTLHGIEDAAITNLQNAWDTRNLWVSGPPEG